MIRHYFAYGSNMNPQRVRERGLAVLGASPARLSGYALTFDKASRLHPGEGHAAIVRGPGQVVEGVLYELAALDAIAAMDPYERAPINYSRDAIWVESRGQPVAAWTYFANPAVCQPGLRPSADYLAHLLAGGEFLSPAYLRWLESFR